MPNKLPAFRQLSFATLLSAVVAVGGCAAVQTTASGDVGVQRKQYMSGLVSQTALEQEAGQQYASILSSARSKGALDANATQAQRVKAISRRLIQQVAAFRPDAANWQWEVHLLSSSDVNAWCMPGGKIAVYTGLINQIKPTDDELAAVIGHEIAHALREHSREQVSQQMATSIGLSVLSAFTGGQATSEMGTALTNVMFTLPNSRTHEVEADRIGVELAARAGYDPRAAVSLWQKMGGLSGGASQPEFLSTHPSPANRSADLTKIAEQVMPLYRQAGGKAS